MSACHEARGEYEQAGQYAWRQVELDPMHEPAHRQLMQAYAWSGRRSAALRQYRACAQTLEQELGVAPSVETTQLYEAIKTRQLAAPVISAQPTPVAVEEREGREGEEGEAGEVERGVFVAREAELARLARYLDAALAGRGQVVCVVGEAGSGKTALVQAFARWAQETHDGLVVANGNCNAHTGLGDPYLPFREILGLLAGDVESRRAGGLLRRIQARRLRALLPATGKALVEEGPELIDTFLSGVALARRVADLPDGQAWRVRLEELVARKGAGGGAALDQARLFEQYTGVLKRLARQQALLLIVDDLQWADAGSLSLLFHLGRQLEGSRILLVGTYRPEDVALGRGGERHPLEPVANEFKRAFGDIYVDLDQATDVGGQHFVNALLDSEPNRLDGGFRAALYRQTGGHSLFTVELLRDLQERGDLARDADGRWVAGPTLNWETLPARVEGAIGQRIGRLDEALREALAIASVEGETFTAEVIAQVQAADERALVRRLSGELDRQHRLVRVEEVRVEGDRRMSRYRFRHFLFQKYLYNSLDQAERAYLHEDVGSVLEGLYGEQRLEIAVRLARHFQEAGHASKAVQYLRQAGERAARLSANEEAIAHFNRGVSPFWCLWHRPYCAWVTPIRPLNGWRRRWHWRVRSITPFPWRLH